MRFGLMILAGLALLLVAADLYQCEDLPVEAAKTEVTSRAHFKLPKFFDFNHFKEFFKKTYSSIMEELVRQKIVLARALKAFVSMCRYKHGHSNFYLRINQNSDLTEAERDKSRVDLKSMISDVPPADVEVIEPAELEAQLLEIEQRKNEPGYQELYSELRNLDGQQASLRRRKRSTMNSHIGGHHLTPEQMDMQPANLPEPPEVKARIRNRVPSNNPEHEQLELPSSASGEEDGPEPVKQNWFAFVPNTQFIKSTLNSVMRFLAPEESQPVEASKEEEEEDEEESKDKVYVDHRESGCFFQVRNQGQCGSCYAFTAIALMEHKQCMESGFLVPFSEQYLVDCGNRETLEGCNGGRLDKTLLFIKNYGLELRQEYPYREKVQACAYNANTKSHKMGYMRVSGQAYNIVDLKNLDKALKITPIMVAMKISTDFGDYGGGVHDGGEDCGVRGGHGMLLVGSGREDGEEYYLLRNSHSISWGEVGYYKLSKNHFDRCALDKFGIVSRTKFTNAQKGARNPMQDLISIKRLQKQSLSQDVANLRA